MKRVWYITRKFPPSTGGMQKLSLHVAAELARAEPLRLVAWRRGNWGLPWFALVATLRLVHGLCTRNVRVLLLGDPVLSWLGVLAKRFGIPVAVVVHGLDITYPARTYQAYLDRMFWGRFDAYICISRHVRRLVDSRGSGVHRTHLIHPGVDLPPGPAPQPLASNPRLLILGRLVPRKGALWFVERVMPQLLRRVPGLVLEIAGDGPDRLAIARAASGEFAGSIRALGEVDEATKNACIDAAHLVVMPNLPVPGDPEGFGLVVLEAASRGRYVFAADLEGLRDAVRQPETGRLLVPADAAAWADAIAEACKDLPGLIELGVGARAAMDDDFTWRGMGKRYLHVLHGLA